MKTYKKSKRIKVFLIVLALIIVLGGVFIYFDWFYMGSNTFNVKSETSLDNSKYEDNGYWWGFNQNKVASINDAVFTFTYDNSNLTNGNSSETNPYTCEFYIVRNGIKEKFGEAPSNRPCNVLTDKANNKVYYIVSEPVGPTDDEGKDITGRAKAVLYTYSYNETLNEVTFEGSETAIPSTDNDGAIIRMGTSISNNGDIMISYGSYDGYIAVYVKAYGDTRWARYVCLASDEGHSMMYNYAVIVNPQKFYVLAVQDWSHENKTFYQYAKLYAYEGETLPVTYADENPISSWGEWPVLSSVASSEGWTQKMVIDKRGSKYEKAVRTEELVYINGTLHIVVREMVNYVKFKLMHYTYENDELILKKDNFGSLTINARIIKYEDKLYYVTYQALIGKIKLVEMETGKLCFRKFVGFDLSGNIYVDRYSDNINVLFIQQRGKVQLFNLQ